MNKELEDSSQLIRFLPNYFCCLYLCVCVAYKGVVAYEGLLYVVGGDDGSSNLSSVEFYNPKSDTWTILTSSLTIGRSYAGLAVIDTPI